MTVRDTTPHRPRVVALMGAMTLLAVGQAWAAPAASAPTVTTQRPTTRPGVARPPAARPPAARPPAATPPAATPPAAPAEAALVTCPQAEDGTSLAELNEAGICIGDRGQQIAVIRRGQRPPAGTDRVIVTNGAGTPLQSKRSVRFNGVVTVEGDTLRSVAYRFSVAPLVLAAANDLTWEADDVGLPAGMSLRVPIRFRAASGFSVAEPLMTGPGVLSPRKWANWGRPHVVRLLANAFRAAYKRWPGRHPAVVGSLSRPGGGRLDRHKSHRAGRDIDIGYYTHDADRTVWGRPSLDAIDYERTWFLIDELERTGQVAAIYMSPRIQVRLYQYAISAGADPKRLQTLFQYPAAHGAKRTLIRYAHGHRDHMHIRFARPADLEELSS